MSLYEAQEAIEVAKKKLPTLCGPGIMHPRATVECFEFDLEGVETALAFLRNCRNKKNPPIISYALALYAERWGCANGYDRCIVANGELIAAASYLNFDITLERNSPNVWIGISRTDVQRLQRSPRYGYHHV